MEGNAGTFHTHDKGGILLEASYGIAAFRSRQQVLAFEKALREAGLRVRVIHTPHEIAIGCGLSVRFAESDAAQVRAALRRRAYPAFVGLYLATPQGARLILKPLSGTE